MILKEINDLSYFDGQNLITNCSTKNEYWLGSSNSEKYLNAYVSFQDEGLNYDIMLFKKLDYEVHKILSDLDAPVIGFFKNDLIELSENFKFKLQKNQNDINEGLSLGHSLNIIIKTKSNKTFFLIFSVTGGRAPEGIYFFGIYKVALNHDFIKKYL